MSLLCLLCRFCGEWSSLSCPDLLEPFGNTNLVTMATDTLTQSLQPLVNVRAREHVLFLLGGEGGGCTN